MVLNPAIAKVVAPDIFNIIDPKDKAYFRESREARFGMTMEALAAQRSQHLPVFLALLAPLRQTLKVPEVFWQVMCPCTPTTSFSAPCSGPAKPPPQRCWRLTIR